MNLSQLQQRMGDATHDEARAMRNILVAHADHYDTQEIAESKWFEFLNIAHEVATRKTPNLARALPWYLQQTTFDADGNVISVGDRVRFTEQSSSTPREMVGTINTISSELQIIDGVFGHMLGVEIPDGHYGQNTITINVFSSDARLQVD